MHCKPFVLVAVIAFAGCSQSATEDPAKAGKMVFVCTETEAVVVADKQPAPAVNPDTGERTLMPGLYCPKCEKWYPAPPIEVLQRNPDSGRCPKTGMPLTAEGPWPEEG